MFIVLELFDGSFFCTLWLAPSSFEFNSCPQPLVTWLESMLIFLEGPGSSPSIFNLNDYSSQDVQDVVWNAMRTYCLLKVRYQTHQRYASYL